MKLPKLLRKKPKSIISNAPTTKEEKDKINKNNNPDVDKLLKTYHVTDIPRPI